jgi:hypothetical protein
MTLFAKVIIGLVLLGGIGGGAYYAIHSEEKMNDQAVAQESTATTTADASTATASTGKKMAFSEFIKSGNAYTCTVHQNMMGTDTQGKVDVYNQMVRGEFTTQAQGQTITTNFLARDGYSYTWTSMMPKMGFKAKVNTQATANTGTNTEVSCEYAFDANMVGDYNCTATTVDNAKFAVPTTIKFTEMSR